MNNFELPEFLTHYYEAADGPFRSFSDLPLNEAEAVQERIRREGKRFASKRTGDYLTIRRELEERIRNLFIQKGGRPQRERPHYLILGACEWLQDWYEDGRVVQIPLREVSADQVSFTYGDSFPAMRFQDSRPYRGKVYTLTELPELIREFGLPQIWNQDGKSGPERYIETQVWDDEAIQRCLSRLCPEDIIPQR